MKGNIVLSWTLTEAARDETNIASQFRKIIIVIAEKVSNDKQGVSADFEILFLCLCPLISTIDFGARIVHVR